jgi:WD40 repeat protein
MSPDGKYIASGGIDKKIYVWSLEAVLERYQVGVLCALVFPYPFLMIFVV